VAYGFRPMWHLPIRASNWDSAAAPLGGLPSYHTVRVEAPAESSPRWICYTSQSTTYVLRERAAPRQRRVRSHLQLLSSFARFMRSTTGATEPMAEVSIRKIVKEYEGNVQAVKGIDLEVADHEFLVLVGPSGCGKTTLLRMIAGLEEITSGEILIGGEIVNDVPPRDRDIAMVFQNYALYPHMNVFDNMAFGLKLRHVPRTEIKQRVDHAAQMLDITSLLDRKPRALSGGQRQRVAMGRAIVRSPKVFLFDEPLSNLDAKLRVQMRTEIKKVHQAVHTTTVYVTHDQVEAMTLADRVVVMNQGIIEQVGPPQELYHAPATQFVAGFIGSPAMNLLPCRVLNGTDGLRLALTNDIVLALPPSRTERYAPYVDRPMLLGIRPEHLTQYDAESESRSGVVRVNAPVDVVEPMGMETMVHFFVDSVAVCARVDPTTPAEPGQSLPLAADLNQMHLIDPDSGRVV